MHQSHYTCLLMLYEARQHQSYEDSTHYTCQADQVNQVLQIQQSITLDPSPKEALIVPVVCFWLPLLGLAQVGFACCSASLAFSLAACLSAFFCSCLSAFFSLASNTMSRLCMFASQSAYLRVGLTVCIHISTLLASLPLASTSRPRLCVFASQSASECEQELWAQLTWHRKQAA